MAERARLGLPLFHEHDAALAGDAGRGLPAGVPRGVSWVPRKGYWRVRVWRDGRLRSAGCYRTLGQAMAALRAAKGAA